MAKTPPSGGSEFRETLQPIGKSIMYPDKHRYTVSDSEDPPFIPNHEAHGDDSVPGSLDNAVQGSGSGNFR